MDVVTGIVKNLIVKAPREGKFGKYFPQTVIMELNGEDTFFNKSTKTEEPIATKGSTVKVLYEHNGDFFNITKIETLSSGEGEPQQSSSKSNSKSNKGTQNTYAGPSTSGTYSKYPTEKDLSQELSGLLQALIVSKQYNIETDMEDLEKHFRQILRLKGLVMQECVAERNHLNG